MDHVLVIQAIIEMPHILIVLFAMKIAPHVLDLKKLIAILVSKMLFLRATPVYAILAIIEMEQCALLVLFNV